MSRPRIGRQRRPAFGFPLLIFVRKRGKQRPAFFGGHFLNIRDKVIGHLVCIGRKVFEKEVHLWQKYILFRIGQNVFLSQSLKDFFGLCKLNDTVGRQRRPAFGFPLLIFVRKRGRPKAGLLWRHFLNIRDKVIGHLVCIGRKVFEKEVHLWQKYILFRIGQNVFLSQMNSFKDFFLYKTNDQWPSLMLKNGRQRAGLGFPLLIFVRKRGRPKAGLLWRPFSQHKRQGHWSFGLHRQKSLWEGGSSVTKIHSFFRIGQNVFLSQMNLFKAFRLWNQND